MADKYRGLTEAEIRADLDQLVEWYGSNGQAAQACGLAKSTLSNARNGHCAIGETVMSALYGPAPGTQLLPFLKPKHLKNAAPEAGRAPVVPAEATALEGEGACATPAPSDPEVQDCEIVAGEASPVPLPAAAEGEGDAWLLAPSTLDSEPQPSTPVVAATPAGPVACGSPPAAERAAGDRVEGEAGAVDGAPALAEALIRPLAPWSKLEDRDLLAILRGRLAGLGEEIDEVADRFDEHIRAAEGLQEHRKKLQLREIVLERVIAIFAEEGIVDGEDSQQAEAAE